MHVEDVRDLVEVRLPTGNRILVIPRMKKQGDTQRSQKQSWLLRCSRASLRDPSHR